MTQDEYTNLCMVVAAAQHTATPKRSATIRLFLEADTGGVRDTVVTFEEFWAHESRPSKLPATLAEMEVRCSLSCRGVTKRWAGLGARAAGPRQGVQKQKACGHGGGLSAKAWSKQQATSHAARTTAPAVRVPWAGAAVPVVAAAVGATANRLTRSWSCTVLLALLSSRRSSRARLVCTDSGSL